MQKITPCLWFDTQAEEAAKFYVSVFKNSKLGDILYYDEASSKASGQPEGSVLTVEFEIEGKMFMGLNGGPIFKLNPSVSFFLNFDPSKDTNARENLDALWGKLSDGGKTLMPLQEYPFSKWYGWVQDKYGVSWQLMLTNPEGEERPFIVPSLMFTGDRAGRADEAVDLYVSLFKNSKRGITARYPAGMEPDNEGTLMFADFQLEGQWFAAMDSAHKHAFSFSEAISFVVNCDTQKEVDFFWEKLIAGGGEESQCGWLKDTFGFSWQITPTALPKMLQDKDPAKAKRAMEAMMTMKKLDLAELEHAYEGK